MSIKRFVSALLAGTLCLSLLAACGSSQKPAASGVSADAQRYSTIFYDAFDTVTQVIAYCDSEEEFNRQMDALHADLLEYHRLYDIYNDYDGVAIECQNYPDAVNHPDFPSPLLRPGELYCQKIVFRFGTF